MLLPAFTWAWDGAELLHKSARWQDQFVCFGLLVAGVSLFAFYAFLEIPSFFQYEKEEEDPMAVSNGVRFCFVAVRVC
jgi:hypothetical protein